MNTLLRTLAVFAFFCLTCAFTAKPVPIPSGTISSPNPEPSAISVPSGKCVPPAEWFDGQCIIFDREAEPSPTPVSSPAGTFPAISGSCATVKYGNRGVPPKGFLRGMARSYARSYCRYKSPATTVAGIIGGPLGAPAKDALALYGASGDKLLAMYALGIGFGMRESSGKYCEGRDLAATNTKAETAEAGPFQASYNSRGIDIDRMNGLWAWYKAHPEACDLAVWSEGVNPSHASCKPGLFGEGPGREWQAFTKSCPAFAAEWGLAVARRLVAHFGPLKRKEAEYRQSCVSEFEKIRAWVDQTGCQAFVE